MGDKRLRAAYQRLEHDYDVLAARHRVVLRALHMAVVDPVIAAKWIAEAEAEQA